MKVITKCTLCESHRIARAIDFPVSPVSNRFLTSNQPCEEIQLSLGICQDCETVQLLSYPSVGQVRPIHSWLKYNEPETHLDEFVEGFLEKIPLDKNAKLLATTYKDLSTIQRFEKKGFQNTNSLDYSSLAEPFGLETVQDYITSSTIIELSKEERFDFIIARHLLEHAHNAKEMLAKLASLLNESGILILELPESSKVLSNNNHAFIWEEHISYFTRTSIFAIAQAAQLHVIDSWLFDYPYEDSLIIALTKAKSSKYDRPHLQPFNTELNRFCNSFNETRNLWQAKLKAFKLENKGVAIFGAGHLAIRFIKFYELDNLIDVVIDDNKHKVGKVLPSTRIKIISSADASPNKYPICLSTLSPESEIKVRQSNDYFSSDIDVINCFKAEQ